MHDRDISGLACRWNLSPELEADRRSLQVEHAEVERQHLEMLASDCAAAAQIAHAEKVRMHIGDCTRSSSAWTSKATLVKTTEPNPLAETDTPTRCCCARSGWRVKPKRTPPNATAWRKKANRCSGVPNV